METNLAGTDPTEHELRVLRAYAEVGQIDLVSERLGIAKQTVKNLLWKVRLRLEVATTVEAVWRLRKELEHA